MGSEHWAHKVPQRAPSDPAHRVFAPEQPPENPVVKIPVPRPTERPPMGVMRKMRFGFKLGRWSFEIWADS